MEFARTIKISDEDVDFLFDYVGNVRYIEKKDFEKWTVTIRADEKFKFTSIRTLLKNLFSVEYEKRAKEEIEEIKDNLKVTIQKEIKELEAKRDKYSILLDKIKESLW